MKSITDIIHNLGNSGYGIAHIAEIVEFVTKHDPNRRVRCMLSRGFSPKKALYLDRRGVWHQHQLSLEELNKYRAKFKMGPPLKHNPLTGEGR